MGVLFAITDLQTIIIFSPAARVHLPLSAVPMQWWQRTCHCQQCRRSGGNAPATVSSADAVVATHLPLSAAPMQWWWQWWQRPCHCQQRRRSGGGSSVGGNTRIAATVMHLRTGNQQNRGVFVQGGYLQVRWKGG